jgi:DNA-binding NtrC family response regulator
MPDTPAGAGRRTILVVDDEDDLREIMCGILERRGFRTLAAADAQAAAGLSRDHEGPIDLLLTDLGLPGTTGGQLAAALTALRPRLRVLYVSGWSPAVAIARHLMDERAVLLQKPFTADRLVDAVRVALVRVEEELPARRR